ncbi:MAG TPA: J domain-containing protein, partial [Verrucomicrobiae bacterium]|nr:J domain-containing protein [Verrucomicrobiae bacterium]
WLDAEALKQKFLSLSATIHPDKIHAIDACDKQAASKKFAELNTAYNNLLLPKSRLLHLLELERGAKPEDIQQIPADLADLFARVAVVCRDTDQFLAGKARTVSPLLQVQLFERGQAWIEQLNGLQKELSGFHDDLLAMLKRLDAQWMGDGPGRPALLDELEHLYRLFSYFNRWNSQIHERIVQLSI